MTNNDDLLLKGLVGSASKARKLHSAILSLKAQSKAGKVLASVVRDLEWSHPTERSYSCPSCWNTQSQGHQDTCELKAALDRWRAAINPT